MYERRVQREITRGVRLLRRVLVVGLVLALSVLLAGCMQPLQTDAQLTPGRPAANGDVPTLPQGYPPPAVKEPAQPVEEPPAQAATETAALSPATEPEVIPPAAQPTEVIPPTPEPSPLPTVQVARPQRTNQDIWREQQVEREPFDQIVNYRAPGKLLLWWFDPLSRQHLPLGWIGPEFQAQARFRLVGSWVSALEVPYRVNQSYGLVLSDVLVERIRAAGYQVEGTEAWIDTYVFDAPDLTAQ